MESTNEQIINDSNDDSINNDIKCEKQINGLFSLYFNIFLILFRFRNC
jgi:hypothetical protein